MRPVQVKCLVFAHQRFDGALLVSQRQSGYRSAWHFHDLIARNLGRDKDSPNFPFFPLLVFTIAKSYPFATCHDTTIIRTFTRANGKVLHNHIGVWDRQGYLQMGFRVLLTKAAAEKRSTKSRIWVLGFYGKNGFMTTRSWIGTGKGFTRRVHRNDNWSGSQQLWFSCHVCVVLNFCLEL